MRAAFIHNIDTHSYFRWLYLYILLQICVVYRIQRNNNTKQRVYLNIVVISHWICKTPNPYMRFPLRSCYYSIFAYSTTAKSKICKKNLHNTFSTSKLPATPSCSYMCSTFFILDEKSWSLVYIAGSFIIRWYA